MRSTKFVLIHSSDHIPLRSKPAVSSLFLPVQRLCMQTSSSSTLALHCQGESRGEKRPKTVGFHVHSQYTYTESERTSRRACRGSSTIELPVWAYMMSQSLRTRVHTWHSTCLCIPWLWKINPPRIERRHRTHRYTVTPGPGLSVILCVCVPRCATVCEIMMGSLLKSKGDDQPGHDQTVYKEYPITILRKKQNRTVVRAKSIGDWVVKLSKSKVDQAYPMANPQRIQRIEHTGSRNGAVPLYRKKQSRTDQCQSKEYTAEIWGSIHLDKEQS